VSDYYEFLQINPKAEVGTIHRVYRFMAGRFHPDNPETGDPEKFLLLNRIYDVLSDPAKRADYDASRQTQEPEADPIFELSAFVNGIEGEVNRRIGILALLYNKRRKSSRDPAISLWDLEQKMAMPREYLDFATWYLKNKGYITIADNSDFTLTALGVDYVEENADKNPILNRLLTSGAPTTTNFNGKYKNERKGNEEQFRLGPGAAKDQEEGLGEATPEVRGSGMPRESN